MNGKNIDDINSAPSVLSAVEGLLGFFSNLLNLELNLAYRSLTVSLELFADSQVS
jgi:hypothetical protein